MSKQNDFIKAPVFGISEDELATGSVNDNEIGTISAKKIRAHSITSDKIAAGAIGAVQLQAGAITAFKVTVPNRIKGTTVVFSVGGTNNDVLQWTSGVAYLQKMKYSPGDTMGDLQVVTVQQTISAGSYQFKSGDSAYYFYVEWIKQQGSDEPADSATLTMQKSTTYPSSDTAIVLAYAWYDPVLGFAQFQALDTAGGGVRISGNSIIAGSITAQNIRAGTITADRLAFPAFDKSIDNLDSISDGITYKKVSATQINTFTDGSNRAITYIGSDGKYQTILQSTAYVNPSQSGLYLTAQHLGFYNASLGGWTVDIRSTGEMFLGSQYNNQYLYWDGNTLTVRGNVEANSVSAGISISSPYISGGTISGGTITGGIITGVTMIGNTFQTNEYAYTYIKIEGQPTYSPPQIQFYYLSQLYHYIQESSGDLYIKALYGNNIYIQANSPNSVYISPSLYVSNAVNIGSATSLSEIYYNSNYYLTTTVGIMLPYGKGIKFNYINTGGDLWFDTSTNTFKYKDTNGSIKTIQAV